MSNNAGSAIHNGLYQVNNGHIPGQGPLDKGRNRTILWTGPFESSNQHRGKTCQADQRPTYRGAFRGSVAPAEAKAKFSEVVRRARGEGPQLVTTRGGKPVVILSSEDYVSLAENRPMSFLSSE
jgi:prevent-host-death family protein